MSSKVAKKKQRDSLIENVKKVPIVQLACQKVGISRATFYRWKKEDKKFADEIDEALTNGVTIINDMAESKLISLIKEEHITAIIYWLKHRHPAYATRVELALNKPQLEEKLSPEEQKIVERALKTAAIPEIINTNEQADELPSTTERHRKHRK